MMKKYEVGKFYRPVSENGNVWTIVRTDENFAYYCFVPSPGNPKLYSRVPTGCPLEYSSAITCEVFNFQLESPLCEDCGCYCHQKCKASAPILNEYKIQ